MISKNNFVILAALFLFVAVIIGKSLIVTGGTPIARAEVLENDGDCVLFLHGISRSSYLMDELANTFYEAGYQTVNIDYPSTWYDLDTLTEMTLETFVPEYCADRAVNFVGHSMGGIITRNYLANNEVPDLGRVVMIASPNKGSEAADFLNKYWMTRMFFGPALEEIGTGEKSVPLSLPEPDYEVGVIAGTSSNNFVLSRVLPGPDDSRVSVESTKLDSMADYMEFPYTHSFITFKQKVLDATLRFIEFGEF
ncbi:alpha/beta fold hydrolase [Candidatus Peregrinibacteria bacterium]|nr:alpha/beta fold hydrolase [Candidatus Peregrinibacteria bacterium]MBT7484670.1 alpha/beta fold hydrolase [Candidatus Peregrinibacteria bacterium]